MSTTRSLSRVTENNKEENMVGIDSYLKLDAPYGSTVVDVFVMGSWRYAAHNLDGIPEVKPLIAMLTRDTDGALSVMFTPGVTGYEQYNFDERFVRDTLAVKAETDKKSVFGGYELAYWSLCRGTKGRWDRLDVLVRSMHEMVRYFRHHLD